MELLQELGATPLPQIFIVAGLFFLVLSIANKLGTKIDINPKRQGQAVIIGVILIVVGLLLYYQPGNQKEAGDTKSQEPFTDECFISIYSVSNNETFHTNSDVCQIHISKGIRPGSDETMEKEQTRFVVKANNKELVPLSEINTSTDENGRHLEQFFELHPITPGIKIKIEGITFDQHNQVLDSRLFYINRN